MQLVAELLELPEAATAVRVDFHATPGSFRVEHTQKAAISNVVMQLVLEYVVVRHKFAYIVESETVYEVHRMPGIHNHVIGYLQPVDCAPTRTILLPVVTGHVEGIAVQFHIPYRAQTDNSLCPCIDGAGIRQHSCKQIGFYNQL